MAGARCERAIRHFKYESFIGDAQPIRFAKKKSKSDAEIVERFTYYSKGKKECYVAYGLHAAEAVARLEDGALAAIDNADSYASYAAGTFLLSVSAHRAGLIVPSDLRQTTHRSCQVWGLAALL